MLGIVGEGRGGCVIGDEGDRSFSGREEFGGSAYGGLVVSRPDQRVIRRFEEDSKV